MVTMVTMITMVTMVITMVSTMVITTTMVTMKRSVRLQPKSMLNQGHSGIDIFQRGVFNMNNYACRECTMVMSCHTHREIEIEIEIEIER